MKNYEELSRKHFNQQAPLYDERDTVYYSREGKISCRDIAEYLRDKTWHSLLDVGCGTGWLIDMLRKERLAEYHGLDLAENMIAVAVSKNIPDAQFVVGKRMRCRMRTAGSMWSPAPRVFTIIRIRIRLSRRRTAC